MSRSIDVIRSEAMDLSPSERASLAHDLILSLDDQGSLDLTSAQEAEIQRRIATIRGGKADGRPSKDVFSEIRAERGL